MHMVLTGSGLGQAGAGGFIFKLAPLTCLPHPPLSMIPSQIMYIFKYILCMNMHAFYAWICLSIQALQLCLTLFLAILWTLACQAPLSTGFSRQEYWSQLPCPPPRDLPDPGTEPASLMFPALSHVFFTTRHGKPHTLYIHNIFICILYYI